MRLFKYIAKRLLFLIPMWFGILVITFVIMRLLPQNPVIIRLGAGATPAAIENLTREMGLDRPLHEQFFMYLGNVITGDLGRSWRTGNPVLVDLLRRFPATIELISLSMFFAIIVAIPVGAVAAIRPKGIVNKLTRGYALLAGALPDFWFGLILIFVFFYVWRIAPAPTGRLGLANTAPSRITGMYVVDSILTADWNTLWSTLSHLALPVFTLAFVSAGAFMKQTTATMSDILESNWIQHARACGIREGKLMRRALWNTLPPVITLIGVQYSFLLGGAVLVETIFSWGGVGQYSVDAILSTDYNAIQGFVLVATTFSLLIYLLVDLLYFLVDPRLEY